MRGILEREYIIHEAGDGNEGYEKALSVSPDFIVSDIMMPGKDGIELLKDLRNDIATSHIPIILLSAKSDIESKLQGLHQGADDYITKPFSTVYFEARISNLLEQRKRLHRVFATGTVDDIKEPEIPLISEKDRAFMKNVVNYIEENMIDNDFSVEDLSKEVGMSRSTFFNKLKSLTGMAPVEFARDLRLQHAARLMVSEQLLVKEACYSSGFTDLKYFGKCFREKYGMTPAEYRKECIYIKQ
jgi:YesN/AraC family two-component response regulator